ncbi:hypothetical protein KR084_012939, partial [Drosophila pseudotakahashii]
IYFEDFVFIDPQDKLSTAWANRNIQDFVDALKVGAKPDLRVSCDKSIYQKALSTPDSSRFIEVCIDYGCQINYVSADPVHLLKTPVSYAVDSKDPGNLAVLLKDRPGIKVDVDRKYGQLTPLSFLARCLKEENALQVLACMRMLLDYGASPNIPDNNERTPLHRVLRKIKVRAKKKELVELFLAHQKLDIDSYCNGEVRRLLEEQFPELAMPEKLQKVNGLTLKRTLRDGDEGLFEKQLAKYLQAPKDIMDSQFNTPHEHFNLLKWSIQYGRQRAFRDILAIAIDIDMNYLVQWTIRLGNWQALEHLLKEPRLQLTSVCGLINTVIDYLNDVPSDNFNHQRCFELLLNCDRLDINQADENRQVPLFYAVQSRNTLAIQKLLKHGAYIGSRTVRGTLPIKDMAPEMLEKHFDSCITTIGKHSGAPDFEIIIDYKNLLPYRGQVGWDSTPSDQLYDEMAPIAFIASSKEMRHLLQHPVISSFLFFKWCRVSLIFYLNLLMHSVFSASIITLTVLKFHDSCTETVVTVVTWLGVGYLINREAIQLMIGPGPYLKSKANLMEWTLIGLSICTCSDFHFDENTQRILAAFTILLACTEFCLLIGSMPILTISTHMLMLREVSINFLRSFTLYSVFVLTFGLCFYILFGKSENTEDPANEKNNLKLNFSTPFVALIKTIVMLTGELNAGDIKFTSVYTYLIFLLFVMFMTIVLVNLLNGLAVNDTRDIMDRAELNGDICRSRLLNRYELALINRGSPGLFNNGLRIICQRLLKMYPNYMSLHQVSIMPNKGNEMRIPNMNPSQKGSLHLPISGVAKLLTFCFYTGNFYEQTANKALTIIDNNKRAVHRREQEENNKSRLDLIEEKLSQLIEMQRK